MVVRSQLQMSSYRPINGALIGHSQSAISRYQILPVEARVGPGAHEHDDDHRSGVK